MSPSIMGSVNLGFCGAVAIKVKQDWGCSRTHLDEDNTGHHDATS